MNKAKLRHIIKEALQEDLGERGDITTDLVLMEGIRGKALILAGEDVVLCGGYVAKEVFNQVDPSLSVSLLFSDGEEISKGQEVLEVSGRIGSILKAERVALNFLGMLSGIATYTREFVHLLDGTGVTLLDTRKTTPGLRSLEKYAVRKGGGRNHRFGLFDGILIKDNHIRAVGSLREALRRAREGKPHGFKVEIEVSNLVELREALEEGADIILLDNMSPDELREAVKLVKGSVPLEVSGGVTLERARDYAELGVDFISVGGITHSAKWSDFTLEVKEVWR